MSIFKGRTTEKESSEWKRNEKIINQTPVLKQARANARGDSYNGVIRTTNPSQAYLDNFDAIFGNKGTTDEEAVEQEKGN